MRENMSERGKRERENSEREFSNVVSTDLPKATQNAHSQGR